MAILLVWIAWAGLSFLVAPNYGDQSIFERLFFSVYTVAVGAAVGFHLFDRLPVDGFPLFALRAAAILLFAILLNEAVVEPLMFGLEPISRAGVYYALTDGLSITIVFVLIRLAQRLRFPGHESTAASGPRAPRPTNADADCFFARVAGGTRRIYPADVIYMQAERDFTRIVCARGEHFASESLKKLLAKSSEFGFVRVHKSFAVNLSHVDQLARSSLEAGGRSIPVGRRYWPDLARNWRTQPGMHAAR